MPRSNERWTTPWLSGVELTPGPFHSHRAMQNMDSHPEKDRTHLARELGRRDAEAFVAELERLEQRQRETRLATLAWKPRYPGESRSETGLSRLTELEERIRDLQAYQSAIENSAPWRLIQTIRRWFGRAW